jgi:hypothetical protein
MECRAVATPHTQKQWHATSHHVTSNVTHHREVSKVLVTYGQHVLGPGAAATPAYDTRWVRQVYGRWVRPDVGVCTWRPTALLKRGACTPPHRHTDAHTRSACMHAHTRRYKGTWVCLQMLARSMSGSYVNFGVFGLYNDPALKVCFVAVSYKHRQHDNVHQTSKVYNRQRKCTYELVPLGRWNARCACCDRGCFATTQHKEALYPEAHVERWLRYGH